jgi:RecB family exonuclease
MAMAMAHAKRTLVATRAQTDAHPTGDAIALDAFLRELLQKLLPAVSVADRYEEQLAWQSVLRQQKLPVALAQRDLERAFPADRWATLEQALRLFLKKSGRVTQKQALNQLAEAIRASAPHDLVQLVEAPQVSLCHILECEPEVLEVLRAIDLGLNQVGGGVEIFLPIVRYESFEERERDAFERLADDWAKNLDIAPNFEELGEHDDSLPACECLRVVSLAEQAETSARQVHAWLQEGVCVDEIAIVLPNLRSESLEQLLRALEALKLPHQDPRGTPVRESEVGRIVLAAIRALSPSGHTAGLASVLASPMVSVPRSLHCRVVQSGVRVQDALFEQDLPSSEKELMEHLLAVRARLSAPITRPSFYETIRKLIFLLRMDAKAEQGALSVFRKDAAPTALEREELKVLVRESRALRVIVESLERLEHAANSLSIQEMQLSAAELLVELQTSIPEFQRLPVAAEAAVLRIASATDALGMNVRCVVVLDGVQEAYAYDSGASEDAFRDSRMVAVQTVLRRAERACLLCPDALFEQGETVSPLLPGPFRRAPRLPYVSRCKDDVRTSRERAREAFFMDESRAQDSDVGVVRRESLAGFFSGALSVTHAERYVKCAFQGLASHVFRASDIEFDRLLLDAREEGSLLHLLLAEVFERLKGLLAERPRKRDAILNLAEQHLALRAPTQETAMRQMQFAEVRDAVLYLVSKAIDDESWNFDSAEVAFGEQKQRGALVMEGVPLEGRIDRIDVSPDGKKLRVVDYKRSSVPERRAIGTEQIQVPIYMQVLAPSCTEVSGLYLAKQKSLELKASDIEGSLDAVAERLQSLRNGDMRPRPSVPSVCVNCSVDGFCRKPIFAVEEEDF